MRAIEELRRVVGHSGGEGGIVLITSLLVMLILLPLGAVFLSVSMTEITIASNEVDGARAFNIAEAGLEHARREVVDVGVNIILATYNSNPVTTPITFTNGGQNVSFAGGTYNVIVQDDNDGDANPNVDANNQVIITSTGTYKNATRKIQATVSLPTPPAVPGSIAAFGPEVEIDVGGNAEINGNNFDPPPFPCSGASCDGILNSSVPAIPGVFFSSTDSELDFKNAGAVLGNPPQLTDNTQSGTDWQNFATTLSSNPDITITGPTTVASNLTWGSPTSPVVVHVTGSETTFSGTINGAGILIVESEIDLVGTLNWQGIVILRGLGHVHVSLTGNSSIYGSVVAFDQDPDLEAEFLIQGNARVRYSRLALDRAFRAVRTTLSNWREVIN